MLPWRLTPQAEHSLAEIADWTIRNFGHVQALKYRDELIACINRLASNEPPDGKDCSLLIKGNPPAQKILYYQQGSHFIVFRKTAIQLEVLEFFHQRMNLKAHLKYLLTVNK